MSQLIRNFTNVLFPFRYDLTQGREEIFNRPITRKNGKQAQLWQREVPRTNHLKGNISAMLGEETAAGIAGQAYAFNDSLRRELDIPEARNGAEFFCRGREAASLVRLEDIRLILFDSGVGFLEFTFCCQGSDPEEFLDVNYFLCEVKSDKNYLQFTQKVSREESRQITLPLLALVEKLTASLGTVRDFDPGDGLRYIHGKPLVFSYLLLDRYPQDLGRLLFNLRTNFKASYQVPAQDLDPAVARGVYHPFENVYWGTSLNGTVCCACLTEDARANDFFSTVFPSNLRQTYDLLFLLRQHQRYAVENYQALFMGLGDGLDSGSAEKAKAAYDRIRALQDRCTTFRLKCIYQDPSSVEHINDFDHFLRANLHIEENLAAFESSLRRLDALAQGIKEKLDAAREEKKRLRELRQERTVSIITALWSCLLLMDEARSLVEHFIGQEIEVVSLWFLLPLGLSMLPALPLLIDLHKKSKELRQSKSGCEMETE